MLREAEGAGGSCSIFIGAPEATAIAFALEGVETPRPLTHDLMKACSTRSASHIEQVVVTELRDTTYFAELRLVAAAAPSTRSRAGPSDAVALAVRVGCPIFAEDDVLVEAGYLELDEDEDEARARRGRRGVPRVHRPA